MPRYDATQVLVRHLSRHAGNYEVRKMFESCGPTDWTDVVAEKGYADVCYVHPEDAMDAVRKCHGRKVQREPIEVALHDSSRSEYDHCSSRHRCHHQQHRHSARSPNLPAA